MPEPGVTFNSEPMPPQEYLMRRSYNPHDLQIPGAVVRTWRCPVCGFTWPGYRTSTGKVCPKHSTAARPILQPYSIDVPLVKTNGERWQ